MTYERITSLAERGVILEIASAPHPLNARPQFSKRKYIADTLNKEKILPGQNHRFISNEHSGMYNVKCKYGNNVLVLNLL